jgi:hypothetical protein
MVKNKRIDNIIIGAKTPFKNRMAYPEVSIGNFRMHHRKCGKRPITRLTCYPLIFFLFFFFFGKVKEKRVSSFFRLSFMVSKVIFDFFFFFFFRLSHKNGKHKIKMK